MPNASLISLIFGLIIVLFVLLGALWGFLAGLKRELKCLAVFVVILGVMWMIFGGNASIDDNVIFGLSGVVNGVLGTPGECTTWRGILLYFGQNNLGLKEILIEGTRTYSLFMNVMNMIVRGVYLISGTVIAIVITSLIRIISHLVEIIIRFVKNRKQGKLEPKTKKTPRISMSQRLWGAGVGFLKSCLLVVLILAPVTVLIGTVNNLNEESENAIEQITMGQNIENSVIDWVFDVVECLDDNVFVNALQSSEHVFGKTIGDSLVDVSFQVKTEAEVVYLRTELNKLIEIVNIVLPTYDSSKKIPFDVWALEEAELDMLIDTLSQSKLVQSAIPVAFEYVGQMDSIQKMLREAGVYNLNEFVQKVDWENDTVVLLQIFKKALKVVNPNEKLDLMNLDSEVLKDVINTLGDTTFFNEVMPIVVNVALSLAVVEDFVGDVDIKEEALALNWKEELINLIDIYGILQEVEIDFNNINLQWLVDVIEDEKDFAVISEALEKLTAGELFSNVLVPVLDQYINKFLKDKNLTEFEGLLSITKMESEDWAHDLPILLEIVGSLSKIGVMSNDIKLNDYDTMHEIIDSLFELIILTDKVKISVDSADLKTLVVEAALRHFKLLDIEELKFELLELRSEIDWNVEKNNLHKLVDTLEKFSGTVNDVLGFEIVKISDFSALEFNKLLESEGLWDNVLDLLDAVVESKLITSALPRVFEKYISPMIFKVNGEIGEIGLFENITSENVVAELYNLVYLALDLREMGIFNVEAKGSFDYNFGATAFYPEEGFYQSEYFTYEPSATDLALVDVVERIFASAILKGREARFIKIILKATLGVSVSLDELSSINYSTEGSLCEKQVLIDGINQLKPLLQDEEFKLFVTNEETGTRKFNMDYFLEKDNLTIALDAVKTLLNSQIVTYLAPEVYNQILVAKGTIPQGWAEILQVQSTHLELVEGINSLELKEDILALINLVEELLDYNIIDIINKEKADKVRVKNLVSAVDIALDTVIDLNIIDGKVGTAIHKVLKDKGIDVNLASLELVDWDSELTYIKNIIGHVGNIAENESLHYFGDIKEFIATKPMDIASLIDNDNVIEIGEVLIEAFNSEIIYEILYHFAFDKLLADQAIFQEMLSTDGYTSEMFRRDLLILADICYQLTEANMVDAVATLVFPSDTNKVSAIDLSKEALAYLLEDVFSLYLVNNNTVAIFETLLNKVGMEYNSADVHFISLANTYEKDREVFLNKAEKINEFSLANKALTIDDVVMFGDSYYIRELYLTLIPILGSGSFPLQNTDDLKNIGKAFNATLIETYKNSELLDWYALTLADALDIFAEMTIARLSVEPIMAVIGKTNIPIGTITLAELVEIDENYHKDHFLGDMHVIADIIRDAVEFELLDVLFKDADIKWKENQISAQNLIKDVFRLKLLDANLETLVTAFVSKFAKEEVVVTLEGPVDLRSDGTKLANAYPYLANILVDTLEVKKFADLKAIKFDKNVLLAVDPASNILDAVREIITMSLLEVSLPGISEALQNTNLKPAVKELFALDDITAEEVLLAVEDLTYPAKELVRLNMLDLIAKKDISLENIDILPAIFERILSNNFIATKHASILEITRLYLGVDVNSFDAYTLDWDYEVTRLVGIVEDAVQIIQNSEFKTANDIIYLINHLSEAKQYLTEENSKELVSLLENVVNSNIAQGLGTGIYEQKILPSLKTKLDPTVYNLIKIDEEYDGKNLFDDLRKVVNALDVVVEGSLFDIVFNDAEIDYVGITPDVKQVINEIFDLEFLVDKTEYIYSFLAKKYPFINTNYIEYQNLDFASDKENFGNGYELVAPLLDSEVNPYQKLSSFKNKELKFNFKKASEENIISTTTGLKLINNTTVLTVNNPLVVLLGQEMYKNADTNTLVGMIGKELFDISLDNRDHVLVSEILHDDINTLLDLVVKEVEAGLLSAIKDRDNYDITTSVLPVSVNTIKEVLDLRLLVELKGQDLLETFMSSYEISDRLDFSTLTYENETTVIKEVVDIIPSVIDELNCKTYTDIVNFYKNIINKQVNYKEALTKQNFSNVIEILDILRDSETVKQAAIPLYQKIYHPVFEQTNNAGLIEFTHIDETIYTNTKFISDYNTLVDMLIELDNFGIYDIYFNDGVIDWANTEIVETVLNGTLGLNFYAYKEKQLIKSIVHTMSKKDANMSLIDTDTIKLSADIDKLVEAYKSLVPVLTKESFPWHRLSDFKQKATIYMKDYADKATLLSIVDAIEALNNTTLNEGTIAYTLNIANKMVTNETINNILSYQSRGVSNQEVIDDINTLVEDGGSIKLLIESGFVDLFFGSDINIILPEVYERIIRDAYSLNILEGQYSEIVKFVAGFAGIKATDINTGVLNADADEELLVTFVKDAVALLDNNGFQNVTSLNKILTLQINLMDYFTDEDLRAGLDVVKSAVNLTVAEAVLPNYVNNFVSTKVVTDFRPLFTFDDNYSYIDLRSDYNEYLYPMLNDLLDFGIVGIIRNDNFIEWDKQKADNKYYGTSVIEDVLAVKYVESKKASLYKLFLEPYCPDVNIDRIVIVNETENFTTAYERALPILKSNEWTYNTYSKLVGIAINGFNMDVLTKDNMDTLVEVLRSFDDSVLVEEFFGPATKIAGLASWIDFTPVVNANAELAEYTRLLNLLDKLNEIGYLHGELDTITVDDLTAVIDMIFGNETLDPAVEGLMCISDQGECIKMLYNAGLLPTIDGVEPNIEGVADDKWHEEIVLLSNIIHSLGAFCPDNNNTIELDKVMSNILHSTDVEALEEVLINLNKSTLYRGTLYQALANANGGPLANYTTTWFKDQSSIAMNDEWDQEVVILARLFATINTLGGIESLDIDNYQTIQKGYNSGDAVTAEPYLLEVNGEKAGLRQIYQLLCASKTYNIDTLKPGIELYLNA